MRKLFSRLNDTILAKRSTAITISFGGAALLLAAALLDHTTWAAAINFVFAGVMLSNGVHAIVQPGLFAVWEEANHDHIAARLRGMFQSVVEHHNETHDPDHKPPGGLN